MPNVLDKLSPTLQLDHDLGEWVMTAVFPPSLDKALAGAKGERIRYLHLPLGPRPVVARRLFELVLDELFYQTQWLTEKAFGGPISEGALEASARGAISALIEAGEITGEIMVRPIWKTRADLTAFAEAIREGAINVLFISDGEPVPGRMDYKAARSYRTAKETLSSLGRPRHFS